MLLQRITSYFCCPPLPPAVLIVLKQNLNEEHHTALGRRGEGKCLILMSHSICVQRVLTRVVAITFKAVNKILQWCYHSNETSVTHLLHSTISFFRILKKKFECLDFFLGLLSRMKRSSNNPSFLLTSIRNLHMTLYNMQMMEKLTTSPWSHCRDNSRVQLWW